MAANAVKTVIRRSLAKIGSQHSRTRYIQSVTTKAINARRDHSLLVHNTALQMLELIAAVRASAERLDMDADAAEEELMHLVTEED